MTAQIGEKRSFQIKVTDEMVHKFAEVSGDYNPIHLDDEYAKATKFGRRIAHGMLMGAFISRALAEHLGTGGVYLGQTMKFTAPVFIGDEIIIELELTKMRAEKGLGFVDTTIRKINGEVVVKGEATILQAKSIQNQ